MPLTIQQAAQQVRQAVLHELPLRAAGAAAEQVHIQPPLLVSSSHTQRVVPQAVRVTHVILSDLQGQAVQTCSTTRQYNKAVQQGSTTGSNRRSVGRLSCSSGRA
eukprot:GHRQ01036930.1.p1 GENE.GHRQ01036930.1~~GHRQ01036930.1.p1  ORF type:complete len:105 (-),score=25.02 GHRQ01036930.1:12-326(-)